MTLIVAKRHFLKIKKMRSIAQSNLIHDNLVLWNSYIVVLLIKNHFVNCIVGDVVIE